ncbi:hypothetical protein B9Z55_017979 [Caenorhabditis nigoni]|uniref:Peptidase C1A papain C-terminal domain-containing protein n=1 Tax=Caenorhabditis nigoni TaxID=1611254 RepID=A0A2G5TC16_9PELO|nr:hypothetical protein B9Z55_017979 [Caenorhabditis nigoni]
MLKLSALFLLAISAHAVVLPNHRKAPALTGQALIDYVNSAQKLWTAGHQVIPKEKITKKLMDLKYLVPHKDEDIVATEIFDAIPDHFDARDQWSSCVSINNIRDQSDCGSCWAFAAAEAISDRTCIASNGAVNTLLSAQDLLSCCTGLLSCGNGCEGGYPIQAWKWWVKHGLVSGGSYESQFGCKPYSIAPCGQTVNGVTWPECPEDTEPTPKCIQACTSNNTYPTPYLQDKHFGATAYAVGKKVEQIQTEILKNGPVEVAFTVYEDFYQYKNGVYVHTSGASLGGHAVKILGWGVDNGTPYWLVANSWNVNWGEKGYFRIIRGLNECGIEHSAVAGIPDLTRHN